MNRYPPSLKHIRHVHPWRVSKADPVAVPPTDDPTVSLPSGFFRPRLVVAAWTVVALVFLLQRLFLYVTGHGPLSAEVVVWSFLGWYVWVPNTFLVLWMARRFPIERGRSVRALALHAGAALGVSLIGVTLYLAVRIGWSLLAGDGFLSENTYGTWLLTLMGHSLALDVLIYAGLVTIIHAFTYYRRSLDQERKLNHAQLHALKLELNPHFLLNALTTVGFLVRRGQQTEAVNTLDGIGALLRQVLDSTKVQEVPLDQEIDFLKAYIAIEKMRFPDRLQVEFALEPEVSRARIPALLLQPLVENAIKHGISRLDSPGHVLIRARRVGDMLYLQVRDNGPGTVPEAPTRGTGVGLANVQARLHQLYGDVHLFNLYNHVDGGAVVDIAVPFVREPDHAPPPRPPVVAVPRPA